LQYCKENKLSPIILETELSGFDHYPTLWDLIEGGRKGQFSNLVVYSKQNLSKDPTEYDRIMGELKKQNIVVHFVFEDKIIS